MVRTVISMNSIDQALRDAHDSRDDDSGHPAAFREVYDQWMQFRAAQLKAVLREADYAEGANQGAGRPRYGSTSCSNSLPRGGARCLFYGWFTGRARAARGDGGDGAQ